MAEGGANGTNPQRFGRVRRRRLYAAATAACRVGTAGAGQRNRGRRQGHIGRSAARRDGGSLESGTHRKDPHRRHRQRRPVQHRRFAARRRISSPLRWPASTCSGAMASSCTSGFTATVNADMQVGALTETITVTGESPLVDTRNARKQTVVSDDLLNVLPSSVKNLNNLVTLTPGFRGNEGFDVTGAYSGQIGGTFHGKGGHERPVRRHGHPARLRQPGLQRQCRDRAGTGACPRAASRPTATPTARS